jgi:predicted enzyme related to lactoylglutathione lyase
MQVESYEPGTPSWVDLGTPDVDGAIAFYGSLFGWEIPEGPPEAGGYRIAHVRGLPVAGVGPQMNAGPPAWATYVDTVDADATAKAVTEAGGTVFVEPFDVMDVGRMAVFADPTGAAISAWQPGVHPGAALVNEPGSFCWNELTTRDADAVIPFYEAAFGWDAKTQTDPMPYTEFQVGGRTVAGMMPPDDGAPADMPPHWLVYFAVNDCDESVATVKRLGGTTVVPATEAPPGRFAVVTDPAGAAFGIIALAS